MTIRTPFAIALIAGLSGCAAPGGPYPSLQPRAAERIDPRIPVEGPVNDRPASSELVARLDALIAQARAGDAALAEPAERARRLAEEAGAAKSESWIVAEQALSAAVAARAPTGSALADVDALGAGKLRAQRGFSPNELKAIQDAGATIGAIDQRQSGVIAAIRRRLEP